jgi:D-alanyl-lipoteichoic acid acyltransferase DltB (MBOAT superfamily)
LITRKIASKKNILIFLITCSFLFYSYWELNRIFILFLSLLINYFFGKAIIRIKNNKKKILIIGIFFNLGVLIYYKYKNFFITNFSKLIFINIEINQAILPLAISFFTFQQISYLVEIYKNKIQKQNFLHYLFFVTFFPHLIAGPMVLYNQISKQLKNNKILKIKFDNINFAICIFFIGLFKKTVLGEQFGYWANLGYNKSIDNLTLIESWQTSLSYSLQIYFDFSAYSDMAYGLALLFNIKYIQNFNSPYKAKNIQDFWRQWHISLYIFFKRYIYLPLGGNKKGQLRTIFNIFLTFLLCGLWHGASWMFIIWGLIHALGLIFYRFFILTKIRVHYVISCFITFNFINFSWIFFRAENFEDAKKIITGMIGLNKSGIIDYFIYILINKNSLNNRMEFFQNIEGGYSSILTILVGLFLVFFNKNSFQICQETKGKKTAFYILMGFVIFFGISFINKSSQFIYFNF